MLVEGDTFAGWQPNASEYTGCEDHEAFANLLTGTDFEDLTTTDTFQVYSHPADPAPITTAKVLGPSTMQEINAAAGQLGTLSLEDEERAVYDETTDADTDNAAATPEDNTEDKAAAE